MTENRMELFIETLTGTAFELSCSPLETIMSIKAKIQYLEGIPVSQQHLIWRSEELNDDLCLQDYCIKDGATLKLVLGMRGGPINTRQVSTENKKLKDLADYVERRSETSGSGGRPFTVLVFHDGDKVHMYTLMERGECSVSPLSGAMSETSSITSIKNVEEVDQDIINENKVTMEKMARLQEQIRTLNLNRSQRNANPLDEKQAICTNVNLAGEASTSKQEFHLPPLNNTESFHTQVKKQHTNRDSHLQANKSKNTENSYFSRFAPNASIRAHTLNLPPDCEENEDCGHDRCYDYSKITNATSSKQASTFEENSISTDARTSERSTERSSETYIRRILSDQNTPTQSSSNLLPYIQKSQFQEQSADRNSMLNLNSPSTIKCKHTGAKTNHKHLPITSNQASSTQRYLDLDQWIDSRPKTSPHEYMCKPLESLFEQEAFLTNKQSQEDRVKKKLKRNMKYPLSVSLDAGEKSNLIMQTLTNNTDIQYDITSSIVCKNKKFPNNQPRINTGSVESGVKGPLSPKEVNELSEITASIKNSKKLSRPREAAARPQSGKKLPLIKAKKKSYKRCTLCSKKTGLATSYTCRCGKNFCATHRYAEVHHCSYDYKTEGRRLLQLNNPVVTASKLPKI